MDFMREILPPKIYESIERAQICTPKQVLILSLWDIKKLSGLSTRDIELLKNIIAKYFSHQTVTCNALFDNKNDKLKSGCTVIDNLLNGGFRKGVLIEIYGESGSGKTQLGMQLTANNASDGSVYICTEDLFPIKRYNQIHESISKSDGQIGNNVFIKHVYEAHELLSCIRIRLPKLLEQHKVSLVIIDSVAAPFRSETTNYIQRAEELRQLASMLTRIAKENNLVVICVNQVTSNFDDSSSKLIPSLGLAWSNMISYRMWLKKNTKNESDSTIKTAAREFKVVFAPDLPNGSCNFVISPEGVTNL